METLLTVKEAAKLLKMSVPWVRNQVAAGRIPYIRLGATKRSSLRFRESDLTTFLEERARSAPTKP